MCARRKSALLAQTGAPPCAWPGVDRARPSLAARRSPQMGAIGAGDGAHGAREVVSGSAPGMALHEFALRPSAPRRRICRVYTPRPAVCFPPNPDSAILHTTQSFSSRALRPELLMCRPAGSSGSDAFAGACVRTTSDSGPGHVLDGCSRWLLCLARARVRCSCDAILTFPALYPVPCAYPWWGQQAQAGADTAQALCRMAGHRRWPAAIAHVQCCACFPLYPWAISRNRLGDFTQTQNFL